MGSAGQAKWVCVNCRPKSKRFGSSSGQNESEEDAVTEDFEVSSLGFQKSMLTKINSLLEMKEKLSSIEASMSFMATRYEELITEVAGLKEENKKLKTEIKALKEKDVSTESLAIELATELAELNQYGRRMNLEIKGVQIEGDPRLEDLKAVVSKLATAIKVEFDPAEIHQAHRLQPRKDGKPPTILIQFHSKTTRDHWLENGKKARLPSIYFGENLCPQYRHLMYEAKLRCKTHNFKFAWFKGGRILVKKNETESNVIVIRNLNDLKKIK